MTPRISRSAASAGARGVTLLTLFAFGCATVRVPASTMSGTVPVHEGVAEPQLELWLESGKQVSPAESAQATAQAKAALENALAHVAAPQGDAVLVVRAQGVARTASRRADQRAAKTGLVVGAVVVVAAVVVVLVASQGKGGGGGVPKLARAAPHAVPRAVPHAVPRGGRIPIPVPVRVPGRVPRSGPAIHVDVVADLQGPVPGPAEPIEYFPGEPPEGWGPEEYTGSPQTPSTELAAIALPPPPPLDVDRRGFFQGDSLRLELVVVDRSSGAPLWSKVVDGEIDPRDAHAVEQLLRDAVADGRGWTPSSAPSPAAPR